VLNRKAEAFYRRHGVEEIEPAAESGIDLTGRRLMTTRLCLQYELGRCGGENPGGRPRPDWILTDGDGRRFRVCFACGRCEMEIYLE
jgi:putative protease